MGFPAVLQVFPDIFQFVKICERNFSDRSSYILMKVPSEGYNEENFKGFRRFLLLFVRRFIVCVFVSDERWGRIVTVTC